MHDNLVLLDNILSRTHSKLNTIVELLEKGEIRATVDSLLVSESVEIKTIFENHATISVGLFAFKGSKMLTHQHKNVSEYLICIKGSAIITSHDEDKILYYKESVLIPNNTLHAVTALEDNTEIVAVCIPAEKGYKIKYHGK